MTWWTTPPNLTRWTFFLRWKPDFVPQLLMPWNGNSVFSIGSTDMMWGELLTFTWDNWNPIYLGSFGYATGGNWYFVKYNYPWVARREYALAGTYDGKFLRGYLGLAGDEAQLNVTLQSLVQPTPRNIGGRILSGFDGTNGEVGWVRGVISEFRLYGRILSGLEISALSKRVLI